MLRARTFPVVAVAVGITVLSITRPCFGAINIDANVSRDQNSASTTVSTPSFSTASGNELLLAFVSADQVSSPNTVVSMVSGAGLNWALVQKTNVQAGTAEIWRAFAASPLTGVTVTATLSQRVASSITVLSFTGVDTTGANGAGAIGALGTGNGNPGAPRASLVTTRGGSLVLGVGNDYDRPIGRTVGTGQVLVHQVLATVGDTYWVQRQINTTATAGTTVVINDTAPTGDRYNMSIVEVVPPTGTTGSTFTISGTVTPVASGNGASVVLTQGSTTIATGPVNSSGAYSFTGVANGTYTVTPSKGGFTFSPASQTVVVNGANVIVPAFTATAVTFSISGTVTPANNGSGASVALSQNGSTIAITTVSGTGTYMFTGLANGTYGVTLTKSGFTFSPASQNVVVNGADATVPAFTATANPRWTISGTVSTAQNGSGATMTLSQNGSTVATTTVTTTGTYSFSNILDGTYVVTPRKSGFTFNPATQTVVVAGANATVPAFTAQGTPAALLYPDLSDIIPTTRMSIVGTGASRVFQYTHDTLNGGPGPLVIQPAYNPATGNYQGTQYIYTQNANGTWTLSQQIPVAGTFVFHSVHGHFHFPFASYGLYTVAADGGPGTAIAMSEKIGFCIADSFIYDSSLPNAGALGNLGSCSDPTSLRGLDIGAVDEYDQTDDGQSISIAGLPDGAYWLRAIVDPNNYFAEKDKTNNETDVEIQITGSTVQVLRTVVPVLNVPPAITLSAPANGTTVSGIVTLTASTGTSSGVQFLIDGQEFGTPVSGPPYSVSWDTTAVAAGIHWLAARTADATGVIGTSPVVSVTVSNSAPTLPTVQITSPASGSILSATTTLYATVASGQPISSVQFYVDNAAAGAPVTAPPYMISWDTTSVPDGTHAFSASATDNLGNTGTSTTVMATVDNSHPAMLIGKDVTVFQDGQGTISTPAFSTAVAGDLIVAFVAYDGPTGTPQTATVSGAGLSWTLLQRANTQAGTAEIWSARAPATLSSVTVTATPGVGTSYHGSLTVIAFTNCAGSSVVARTGAPSGAPDIFLPGVIAGDWVFAVGNDWDNAIARVPVSGQVLVHQRVDTAVGDTFWVQSTASPSTANGLVDIHDTSPTSDRWNYAAVEIVARHQ